LLSSNKGGKNMKKIAIRMKIENEDSHKEKKKKSNYYFHLL
jgi:hypothetical protein